MISILRFVLFSILHSLDFLTEIHVRAPAITLASSKQLQPYN